MSVIAAIVRDGHAVMACDSRVSFGAEMVGGAPKVFKRGRALVGLCGSLCFLRALRDAPPLLRAIEHDVTAKECEDWCGRLVDYMIAWGKERGQGQANGPDFSMTVATTAGIWRVVGDGSVTAILRGWDAIGSGGAEARAVLHLAWNDSKSLRDSVTLACSVAAALDSSCGLPIETMELT